ncbi:MAG TPA: DUF2393 family protein [Terriglobales bacterium]|nr:DUF2393 family protein [Terriglobales bacterium]
MAWPAIGAGALLVVLAIGALVLLTRPSGERTAQPVSEGPHAYGEKLQFADLKMSEVANFVGGKVTYLEGQLTNQGDRTVSGVTVEIVFRNSLGEVVQKETLPVKVHEQRGPYVDVTDLKAAPLKPGETRGFRLIFDHVSADWNREYPAITVTAVSFN